jgi:hypothetical protein
MTPESIAGFKIPEHQLQDLIDALAEMEEDNVIPLHPVANQPKAA